MRFPKFLKAGDTIGVTAPSGGITKELKVFRTQNSKNNLKKFGIDVVFDDNVFTEDEYGNSSSANRRAAGINKMMKDDNIDAIVSACGGDFLYEILPLLDWEYIKNNPKWFQGFSDNTGLVYPLVTKCDIAAIYGCNIGDFGMGEWSRSVTEAFDILQGKCNKQKSFDYYENDFYDYVTGLEDYHKDKKVWWNNYPDKDIDITGRIIGGCFDVIVGLLGTRYDGGLEFCEKYKDDGIIWCFETFNMDDLTISSHLWQMKEMGYFKNAAGIVFGRPMFYNFDIYENYQQGILRAIEDFNIPIIFVADLGNKGPHFSWVMGAKANIVSSNGKGEINYLEF